MTRTETQVLRELIETWLDQEGAMAKVLTGKTGWLASGKGAALMQCAIELEHAIDLMDEATPQWMMPCWRSHAQWVIEGNCWWSGPDSKESLK